MPPTANDGVLEDVVEVDVAASPTPIGDEMAEPIAESANIQVALTGMANEFAASAGRRTQRADQLAGDADRMWSISMTTPNAMAALAMRVATESGSGRTRAETNLPAATSAAGNG